MKISFLSDVMFILMIATANLISVVGATDTEERERVYSFDNYYISTQLSGYTIESIVANTRLDLIPIPMSISVAIKTVLFKLFSSNLTM